MGSFEPSAPHADTIFCDEGREYIQVSKAFCFDWNWSIPDKRGMQIFIRVIVLLFVVPFAALVAGMLASFVVLPSLGVEPTKQGPCALAVILAVIVGSTWLYVRSWKTGVQSADAAASRSSTSLRGGFVWALAIIIGGPFLYLMFQSSSKDAERKQQSGYAEFEAANNLLISGRQGVAHGNTDAAQVLAKTFSLRLKEARKLGIESRKSAPIASLTQGEFITYCLLTKDSCVFMVHVPDLRGFSSEAKDFISEAAWDAALAVTGPLKLDIRNIVIGLRGVLLYDRVVSGRLDSTANSPLRPGNIQGDTECQKFLQGFFAPNPQP